MRSVSSKPKPVHHNAKVIDLQTAGDRRPIAWHLRRVDGARLLDAPECAEEVRHG